MVAKWYIHVHYTANGLLQAIGAAYSGLLLAKKRNNQITRKDPDSQKGEAAGLQ